MVEPVVDVATEFIGSAGVVAVLLLMTLEAGLHAGAQRGDDAPSPTSPSPRSQRGLEKEGWYVK